MPKKTQINNEKLYEIKSKIDEYLYHSGKSFISEKYSVDGFYDRFEYLIEDNLTFNITWSLQSNSFVALLPDLRLVSYYLKEGFELEYILTHLITWTKIANFDEFMRALEEDKLPKFKPLND